MKTLDDAAFKEAVLNGDHETLAKYMDNFDESDDDQDEDEQDENSGDGVVDDLANVNDDDSSNNDVDDTSDKDETENTDKAPSGLSKTVEELQAEITFDDQGRAIIPKELLELTAKDGKHHIPYGILEDTRTKAKDADTALREERKLRQAAEELLGKNTKQAELLRQQLVDNDLDPDQLGEDIELTDELIKSLDDYGDIGKVMKALIAKQGTVKDNVEATKPTQSEQPKVDPRYDDYSKYVAENPRIAKILDNVGSDEAETLDFFFNKVSASAEFKNQPFKVQLDEAVAKFDRAFGNEASKPAEQDNEQNKAIARQKANEARLASTPASPSEVGERKAGEQSNADRARSLTGTELQKFMDSLSQSEIDELIYQLE